MAALTRPTSARSAMACCRRADRTEGGCRMDERQWRLLLYLREVRLQCRYALTAADALEGELQARSRNMKNSKCARAEQRAAELHRAFRVSESPDDSPIGSRRRRDVFEHFERWRHACASPRIP